MQTSDMNHESSLGMRLAQAGFAIALAAVAAALLSGLGHRWGWGSYQTGFLVLQGAGGGGVAPGGGVGCVCGFFVAGGGGGGGVAGGGVLCSSPPRAAPGGARGGGVVYGVH